MIVTGCGLFYHVEIIYRHYMSGKTVVSLEIGNTQDQTPPAITKCYPYLFSMELAAQFHPGFTEMNRRYQELLKNKSVNVRQFYLDAFSK